MLEPWELEEQDRTIGKSHCSNNEQISFFKRATSNAKLNIYKILSISHQIAEKIPNKNDNIFSSVIKIGDILQTLIYHRDNKLNNIERLCKTYNTCLLSNKEFVNMFTTSGLSEVFTVTDRDSFREAQCLVKYHHDDVGDIYLVEVNGSAGTWYREAFLYSKDINFKAMSNLLWGLHNGRIEVKEENLLIGNRFVYSSFPYINPPTFGASLKILQNLKQSHKAIIADNISRTYLFLGKPGVGKTTLALRFATECGGNILRISANLMSNIQIKNLSFLISILQPNFIVVDDIDKANSSGTMPELLTLIEDIKLKFPNVGIILTANNSKVMEESLLRPGRIDTIVTFPDPDEQDRYEIIKGYAESFMIDTTEEVLKELADISVGMSGAWLKEIVIKLKYSSAEEVFDYVKSMILFLSNKEDE